MRTPRETGEWRYMPIYERPNPALPDTIIYTGPVEYSIVVDGQRPTIWTASDKRGGNDGAKISGLGPGVWHAYVRITVGGDQPVIDYGTFILD